MLWNHSLSTSDDVFKLKLDMVVTVVSVNQKSIVKINGKEKWCHFVAIYIMVFESCVSNFSAKYFQIGEIWVGEPKLLKCLCAMYTSQHFIDWSMYILIAEIYGLCFWNGNLTIDVNTLSVKVDTLSIKNSWNLLLCKFMI